MLSDAKIKALKPTGKKYKTSDFDGLYIEVTAKGSKIWRFKYRMKIEKGRYKEKLLTIGHYPEFTLKNARAARDVAREQVAKGLDPSALKQKVEVVEESFRAVAEDWLENVHTKRVSEAQYTRNRRRLELYVYPKMGRLLFADITPAVVLKLLRGIESKGKLETLRRVKTLISQVYRYAIAIECAERDPTRDIAGMLPMAKPGHFPAVTDPEQFGGLLRAIDADSSHLITNCALKLSALVFTRPNELRQMRWVDVNLQAGTWLLQLSKSKQDEDGRELLVPLARQAVALLSELQQLTGSSEFVFPSPRSNRRPLSDGAMNGALARLGYKGVHSPHGFRASARTMLEEVLECPVQYIEHQLGHLVRDPLGRAYNRTQFIKQRTEMMQAWADYLDKLRGSTA